MSSFESLFRTNDVLEFTVNGRKVSIKNPDPRTLLFEWLRHNSLTGTKFSCGQGGCGACTVIICPSLTQPVYRAVNACLRPLVAMHGLELLTIEGIGSTMGQIDIVQETIAKYNGTQCGYCTPGFVCAMKSYLLNTESNPQSRNLVDIEDIFDGHLCRCTGYRPILCGMKTFSSCGNKEELKNTPPIVIDPSFSYSTQDLKHKNVAVVDLEEIDYPLESSAQSIPALRVFSSSDGTVWMKILSMIQLAQAIKKYSSQREKIRLVVGNTASGIQIFQDEIKKQNIYLYIADIPELQGIQESESSLVIGATERLQSLYEYINKMCSYSAVHENSHAATFLPSVIRTHMMRLATTEIRNAGCVAGNLYLAKKWGFPSDLICLLMTMNGSVMISVAGTSSINYNVVDFMDDKRIQLDGTNIIQSITMPIVAQANAFIRSYKVSRRPQNSHPIVNAGFAANVDNDADCFRNVRITIGNIASKTQRMTKTEQFMMSNCLPSKLSIQAKELLSTLYSEMSAIIVPSSGFENLPPKKSQLEKLYRLATARNLFLKFVVDLVLTFKLPCWPYINKIKSSTSSLITKRMESSSSGSQDFCVYKDEAPISEPIVKNSAFLQACGEAKYSKDIAMSSHDLLHGVYIFNTKYAHAKFHKIVIPEDFYKKFPDVVKVFTAEDVDSDPADSTKRVTNAHSWKPNTSNSMHHRFSMATQKSKDRNDMGHGYPGLPGDTLFAKGEVIYIGQPVGMVVANDDNVARDAANWLQENAIKWYSIDEHPILDLDDAIEKKHFFPDSSTKKGYPTRLLKVSRPVSLDLGEIEWDPDWEIVDGSQVAGSQYHFYMETQTAVAFPLEGEKLRVIASSQSPAMVQSKVALVCNLPMHSVNIEMTRIGGGYGGKEVQSQFVAVAASFCAHNLRRPVSVSLLRTEDMNMTGKRHEVLGKYRVAASKDGKIHAMQLEFVSDGGCTYDASFPVMDLILLSADNAYYIPQFVCKGDVAMTFKATGTAFRSFGVVQTMLIVESAMEAISEKLGLPAEEVRMTNFYNRNNKTPYGQTLRYCNLKGVWDQIYETSNYEQRKVNVAKFNKENMLKKRGIKLIPLKYGISFTHTSMNQGGAAVNVYSNDGTILINIGGVEMGQGLNTKMMQIAAYTLDVPYDYITVGSTSTDKVPNPPSTGASTGSDLNGGAVSDACKKLHKRLQDFLDELVKKGNLDRYRGEQKTLLMQWNSGNKSWKGFWPEVVSLAFNERVSLSAQGFYAPTDLDQLSTETPKGRPFYYFNYAAAVSEVEVDVLTGETNIIRSDIVYDAGHSLNPAIDVGQIEGGFVMGIGNVLTEELRFDKDGRLITDGTWEYKPPDTKTIPQDLRVTIYPGANKRPVHRIDHTKHDGDEDHVYIDPHGIQSSKATGEPPLVLANSVFFAIRDAVKEARKESGLPTDGFKFDSPASEAEVQLACGFDPNNAL